MHQQNTTTTFAEMTARYLNSPALNQLIDGELTVTQYRQVLLEIYCTLRETRRSQALASVFLPETERQTVQPFLNHHRPGQQCSEMALSDLRVLGEKPANLERYHPLPSTMGLISFPFYQLNYENPLGYLGYLHVIEQLPAASNNTLGRAAREAGVPAEAMTFFQECFNHQPSTCRLTDQAIEDMATTPIEHTAIKSSMETTIGLYTAMIGEALRVGAPKQ